MPMADPLDVDRIQMRIMKAKAELAEAQRITEKEDVEFSQSVRAVKHSYRTC